ncbi:MAG: helix-turn-helix transcriptional regulator [Saprospiraceae bacterium]|nr:helix-turn-helix transcriptional regulator [Saprospiraceae bacterium]
MNYLLKPKPNNLTRFMLFYFNQYSSLLLPSFVQGVLFSALLFYRGFRDSRLSDKLLALLLFVYTLRITNWMLGFANWYDIHDWHTTVMFYTPFNHWLAVGPLIYFYFLSLTNRDFTFERKHWLHFLPEGLWLLRFLIIFLVDVVWQHWVSGNPFPEFDGTQGKLADSGLGFFDGLWPYLEYISVFIYFFLTLRLFQKYKRYILENFSDTENINFLWLRNILIANIIGHLVWIGFDIADFVAGKPLSYVQDWYSFFFLGVVIYYLSIEGYYSGAWERQQAVLSFRPESPPAIQQPLSADEDRDLATWKTNLLAIMEKDKPHLNAELSLNDLADKMKISPAHLSKVVNSGLDKNFNDFVNGYRVEAVKNKMSDPSTAHLTLLGIAYECGFNSKATFNRAFKKHAGVSPSAFLKASGGKQ